MKNTLSAEQAFIAMLQRLDADYIAHHLSPGGCSDLLGIALLVTELEGKAILKK